MKRRALLASIAVSTTVVAGCLSGDDDTTDTTDDDTTDTTAYERCDNRIVLVSNLPDSAADEARTAIEHGVYETDGGLVLADVMRVEDAYLEDDGAYYRPTVSEENDVTALAATREWPTFERDVLLENATGDDVTADLHVEHEQTHETVLEAHLDLEPGEELSLNEDVAFPYGDYRAELTGEEWALEDSWELNWHFEAGPYPIDLTDDGLFEDPIDRASGETHCRWDEGDVSTGFTTGRRSPGPEPVRIEPPY